MTAWLYIGINEKGLYFFTYNPGEKQTFALFQSNDPAVNESLVVNSSITTPDIYSTPVCLKFWYLMPNQNSRLEVYTVGSRDNKTNSVYTHAYSPASQWAEVKVLVSANAPYKVSSINIYYIDLCIRNI